MDLSQGCSRTQPPLRKAFFPIDFMNPSLWPWLEEAGQKSYSLAKPGMFA
jgi:hypothetical protein